MRREGILTALVAQYLRHVERHKSDDDFSAVPRAERQQLRLEAIAGKLIEEASGGLALTDRGRRQLAGKGHRG